MAVSVATERVDEGNAARPARSTSTVMLAQRPDGRPHPPVQFAVQPGGRVEVPGRAYDRASTSATAPRSVQNKAPPASRA
ncbi:MAG: hypothetical protein WBR28_09145, partial [Mycobacterium sp.]